jgi:hydrogenase expression/formation protein HypC
MMQHEAWAVGDYLVSHLGQAIQKLTQEEAETAWALYDEMIANTVAPDA